MLKLLKKLFQKKTVDKPFNIEEFKKEMESLQITCKTQQEIDAANMLKNSFSTTSSYEEKKEPKSFWHRLKSQLF